ncbi:hypothetical protein D9M72_587960 [compost metagenome]
MPDQRQYRRANRFCLLEQRHAFLRGAGEGGNDHDGPGIQVCRSGKDELCRQVDKGGKAGLALKKLGCRLHQDGGASRSREKDVLRAGGETSRDGGVQLLAQCASAQLDAKKSLFVEVQHGTLSR